MPQLHELWRDPDFHALPPEERRKAVDWAVQGDSDFQALPHSEQTQLKAEAMASGPQGIEAEPPTFWEREVRKGQEALDSSRELLPGAARMLMATGRGVGPILPPDANADLLGGAFQVGRALGSPSQLALGAAIGAPVEHAAAGAGVPEDVAQQVGNAAELAGSVAVPTAASRGMIALPELLEKHAPIIGQFFRALMGISQEPPAALKAGPMAGEAPSAGQKVRPTGGLAGTEQDVQQAEAAVGRGPEYPPAELNAAPADVPRSPVSEVPEIEAARQAALSRAGVRATGPAAEAATILPAELHGPPPFRGPQLEVIPGGKAPTGQPPGPLPKYAGSVNLDRIRSTEDVKRAIVAVSEQIPKAQPIQLEEVAAAARKLGFALEDAERFAGMTRKQRAMWLATRDVHTALQERYIAARTAFNENPTRPAFEALKKAQASQLRGFAAAQTVASEAGRALGGFRSLSTANISAERANRVIGRLLLEVERKKGKIADEITARLASTDLSDPEKVNELVRYLSPGAASFRDKLFEFYNASILSGPLTHIVNNTSNLLSAAAMPVETAGTALAESLRGSGRAAYFGEAPAQIVGMANGIEDGVRTFLRTMAHGASDAGKLEIRGPAIGGLTGKAVRLPLTALSAEDDFWKTVVKRGTLYSEAYRSAAGEGLRGRAAMARAAELVQSPTEEMLQKANSVAAVRTFQEPAGRLGRAAYALREQIPFSEFVAPFVRTPINITKQGLQRTPLNFLRIAYLKSRGELQGRELSEELSKAAIGSGIAAVVAMKAAGGALSGGGPVDPEQRKALLATGWQPYSFRAGDRWYSYARLEPLATVIGTVADTVELTREIPEGDFQNIATKTGAAIAKNLTSKTWLQGLSDFLEVFHDPGNKIEKFAGSMAGAAVPSAAAQVARAQDPSLREVRTMLDSIRARIPGVREELPPKLDVRGHEIPAAGSSATRFFSPVQVSDVRGGPIERRMVEVQSEIAPIGRTIAIQGHQIRLSDDDYARLQRTAGEAVDRGLTALEGRMEKLDRLPVERQKQILREIVNKGREAGRQRFLMEALGSGRLGALRDEALAREARPAKSPYAAYVGNEP